MHELGIMESALDAALVEARKAQATTIHRLRLRVGALSGVVSEALRFAFDVLTQGTMAEGAILEIEEVAVRCRCPQCDLAFQPLGLFHECPQCKRFDTVVLAGEELELVAVEVSSEERAVHE